MLEQILFKKEIDKADNSGFGADNEKQTQRKAESEELIKQKIAEAKKFIMLMILSEIERQSIPQKTERKLRIIYIKNFFLLVILRFCLDICLLMRC